MPLDKRFIRTKGLWYRLAIGGGHTGAVCVGLPELVDLRRTFPSQARTPAHRSRDEGSAAPVGLFVSRSPGGALISLCGKSLR